MNRAELAAQYGVTKWNDYTCEQAIAQEWFDPDLMSHARWHIVDSTINIREQAGRLKLAAGAVADAARRAKDPRRVFIGIFAVVDAHDGVIAYLPEYS